MSQYNKMQLLEIFNQCEYDYKIKDYIIDLVLDLIKNSKNSKIFKVTRQLNNCTSETIVIIKYFVPTKFKQDRLYEIPIIIYIPKSFPYIPPDIFIEKNSNELSINPNCKIVDPNTFKIILQSLQMWSSYTTLTTVIGEINTEFNATFPIFNKSSPTKNQGTINTNTSNTSSTTTNNTSATTTLSNNILGQYTNNQNNNQTNTNNSNYNNNINSNNKVNCNDNYFVNTKNNANINMGLQPRPSVPNIVSNFDNNTNNIIINNNNFNHRTSAPNITMNYDNINNKNNTNNIDIQNKIKQILISEIKDKIYSSITNEIKQLKKVETCVNNYKNTFQRINSKYENIILKKEEFNIKDPSKLIKLEQNIQELKQFVDANKDFKIDKSNCLNYINIKSEKEENILKIIASEATLEDFINVVKKAFERGIMNFHDTLRIIRITSRELMKIKFIRENLTKTLFN